MRETMRTLWQYMKEYAVEMLALTIFIVLSLLLLFDSNFSGNIITNFEAFRPDYAIIWFGVMSALTALLALLYRLGTRRKKLRSTMRKSAFAKTLVCSDIVRMMSQTQTAFDAGIQVTGKRHNMPKDVDTNHPNVIELYFTYEENLNI